MNLNDYLWIAIITIDVLFISQLSIYLLPCEQAHDDGDDVIVIMYVNVRYDERGCVHSKDESKLHRVDMALNVDTGDY